MTKMEVNCQHGDKVNSERKIKHMNLQNVTHLPDFHGCATHVGDAWQRATLTTLWVRDHLAVTALQRNLAKLDPLSAGYAGFRLNDL